MESGAVFPHRVYLAFYTVYENIYILAFIINGAHRRRKGSILMGKAPWCPQMMYDCHLSRVELKHNPRI